jgi:catalase
MPLTTDEKLLTLSHQIIEAFDKVDGGIHPGFRPAHAKGILLAGVFTPSSDAASLTRAPHLHRNSTPVTARFSNFAGIPTVPDNDPQGASPRGFAVRFHLAEHVHTDIVAHSVDNFPTRTAERLLEFLTALTTADSAGPDPIPWRASRGVDICANAQADPDQLCEGVVFRGIGIQIHQRGRCEPLWAVSDIARSRQ